MREIKFRGKSKNTGDWLYGVPVKSVNDNMYLIHSATEDAINTVNDVDFVYSEVIPETVGQFTGYTGRDKLDIYEGDIIQYCDDPPYAENYIIKYNEEEGRFYAENTISEGDDELLHELDYDYIRVIGNVFDNPEKTH